MPQPERTLMLEHASAGHRFRCSDCSKTLDILMLKLFEGSQRTSVEYRTLLSDSGFRLERIY
jgi:hypothetical protein